jgi:phospholipid-translocating ATPase
MGIILKQEDTKRIIFYLKGADTVIKNKVPEVQRGFLLEECESLAREGLRTLCFCQKVLLEPEYLKWAKEFEDAQNTILNRD